MKNTAVLFIAVLSALALVFLSNCAQPLESEDLRRSGTPGNQLKIDTLYLHDTIIVVNDGEVDTIIVTDTILLPDTTVVVDTIIDTIDLPDTTIVDTVVIIDTVVVSDTVVMPDTVIVTDTTVDTVIVVEPGDGPMLCDRLSCAQKEIVWLFRNTEGLFHLEFAALPQNGKPQHTLTVWINEQPYAWNLSSSLEFILDTTLPANATMRITTSKPPSYGHAIDVCLTWTAL